MLEAPQTVTPIAESRGSVASVRTACPPKLAVVISCYNYEDFVERAISSALNQGRDDCEVIVVDDGSTDNSWAVICRSGARAFRIRNSGQRAACLFGFEQTRAPYVLFLDADDELKPGAIEAIIGRLDPQVAKLQFPLTPIDADGRILGEAHPALEAFRSGAPLARRVLRNGVYKSPPTSGNVFRRDLCEVLRDAGYDNAVDGVILFAAPFFGDVLSVSEPLGLYRIHTRNKSGVGRTPDASLFRRDMDRFLARMDHLGAVIQRSEPGLDLPAPQKVFYYNELSFWHSIASGRRPPLTDLMALLDTLLGEDFSFRNKIAMAAFFLLAAAAPNAKAKALLAYRFKVRRRSTSRKIAAP